MNHDAIVFADCSSITEKEWSEIRIREDLFSTGLATIFRVKEMMRPTSPEALRYIDDLALKRKTVRANGDWEL